MTYTESVQNIIDNFFTVAFYDMTVKGTVNSRFLRVLCVFRLNFYCIFIRFFLLEYLYNIVIYTFRKRIISVTVSVYL